MYKLSFINKITAFKPMNERISQLRIKTEPSNVSIISTNSSTEENNDLIKDALDDKLESVIL